jgi:chromosome segregation ATPase
VGDELDREGNPVESEESGTPEGEGPGKTEARLEELEEAIAGKDAEIASLKQDKAEMEDKLATLESSLSEAVASYRELAVQSNPEVVEELLAGDTIEAVNESLEKAKNLVSRVRQGVEAEISQARVPAGAPERTPPDLSALSPREKIRYAIGGSSPGGQ